MPFRSEKQRRYLWKNHPKIARDWTDTYGSKPVKKNSGGSIEKPPKKGWTKIFGEPLDWDNLTKDQEKWLKDNDFRRPQKKSKGGTMDPYYGSYIKGTVDGKTLSNPSYRKYYKGLI